MEIKDFDQKKEYAMDFYEQAVEINQMVHDSIRGFHYLYCYNLQDGNENEIQNPEKLKLITKRKRQLLIELGRAGEYAIKYLLLMQQMQKYPNQSFEEFRQKTLYSMGDKSVRNTYINQYHLDAVIVDDILHAKEEHSMQPLHDYSYLFTILEKMYPDVVGKLQENLLLEIKAQYCQENKSLTKEEASVASFFSCVSLLSWLELSEDTSKAYIEDYRQIMEKSGDAFVKLRYLENNVENKEYDLNEVIYLLDNLIDFITLTHEYNKDNPENSINGAFLKKRIAGYILPQGIRKYDDIYLVPKKQEDLEKRKMIFNVVSEVIDKYPNILNTIDFSQLMIWKEYTKNNINLEEVLSNFIDNLTKFHNDEEVLLNKFPLLLPTKHIEDVKQFMKEIGIELSTIDKTGSGVLCVPIEYLRKGYECIENSDVSPESLIIGINKYLDMEKTRNSQKWCGKHIKVYRCCGDEELAAYKNKQKYLNKYGRGSNTFKYEEGKNYIHFFLFAECAAHFYKKRWSQYTKYFVECEIPSEVLDKYYGYGWYEAIIPGYYVPVPEFAIPFEEFSADYVSDTSSEIKEEWLRPNEWNNYLMNLPKDYLPDYMTGAFKEGYDEYSILEIPKNDLIGDFNAPSIK